MFCFVVSLLLASVLGPSLLFPLSFACPCFEFALLSPPLDGICLSFVLSPYFLPLCLHPGQVPGWRVLSRECEVGKEPPALEAEPGSAQVLPGRLLDSGSYGLGLRLGICLCFWSISPGGAETDDPTLCLSQTPSSRRREGDRERWEAGKRRKEGRLSNQPVRSRGWAGGSEILGAEGQKGAPHLHTLLPDCPDTEAADAPGLILDNHIVSWRKVERQGGREGGRDGRERRHKP